MQGDLVGLFDAERGLDLPGAANWVAIDRHFAVSLPTETRPGWRCEWWKSPDANGLACFWGEFYNPEEFAVSEGGSAAQQLAAVIESKEFERFGRVNGSFVFMHYEKGRRRATVVRDPVGFTPLYFAQDGARVGFASRIGALKGLGLDIGGPDVKGLAELFTFQHPLGQRTLFDRVWLVPHGVVCRWTPEGPETRRCFHFPTPLYSLRGAGHLERMRVALNHAVALRCREPTALWLSGGMDSRCLFSCLVGNGAGFTAWTTGRPDSLDCMLARRVARAYGVPHRSLSVGREFFSRFSELAAEVADMGAGEVDVQRAHGLLLYPVLRAHARVVLGGICIGVTRPVDEFRSLPVQADRPTFGHHVLRFFSARACANPIFSSEARAEIRNWIEDSVAARLDDLESCGGGANWETAFWLHEVYPRRWGSQVGYMRRYLDVRYPYFDSGFLGAVVSAPPLREFEYLLPPEYIIKANCPGLARWPTTRGGFRRCAGGGTRQALCGTLLLNASRACKVLSSRFPVMSRWAWDRRTFLPYSQWFARPLYPVVREILLDSRTTGRGIFDRRRLEEMLASHAALKRDHTSAIAFCLTVELAYRALID